MNVDQAFVLVDFIASKYFNFAPTWKCGEHGKFIVRRILLSFSFEISMTTSDSLFDLKVASLIPIS